MKDSMPTTLDQPKRRSKQGFTVTELLIAMAILALVLGVIIPTSTFSDQIERSPRQLYGDDHQGSSAG